MGGKKPNDDAQIVEAEEGASPEGIAVDKKADTPNFPEVPDKAEEVHEGIQTALLPPDSPESLKQRLEGVKNIEELKKWLLDYFETWVKLPVIQTLFKITPTDENTFRANFLKGMEEEVVVGDVKLSEIISEFGTSFLDEDSAFNINFPLPTDEKSIDDLRRMAALMDFELDGNDFPGSYGLVAKISALETLYKKELAGTSAEDYLASIDLDVFEKREFGYKASKVFVINFYSDLTDQGEANLKILVELGISFSHNAESINKIPANLLPLLLPIKEAGISFRFWEVRDLMKETINITAEDVDVFCAIHGHTDYTIHSLEEIEGLVKFQLTPNAIKAIRILWGNGQTSYNNWNWKDNVEDLNKIDDKGLRGLEVLKTNFHYNSYSQDYATKFKLLGQASAEAIEILETIRTLDFPDNRLNFLNTLSYIDKYKISNPTEESLKIINLIIHFIYLGVEDYNFSDEEDFTKLIIRAKKTGITSEEFEEAMSKVDTPENRTAISSYSQMKARVGIINWILFVYGGMSNFSKLYEAGVLERRNSNGDYLFSEMSKQEPDEALKRLPEYLKIRDGRGMNLEITALSDEDVEKLLKIKKHFSDFTISDFETPDWVKDISQEQWLSLEVRLGNNQGLSTLSSSALIKKVIEMEDPLFEKFSLVYNKIPINEVVDSRVECALSIVGKYTEEEMPEIITIMEKSRSIDEINKRLSARLLFSNDPFRMETFNQLIDNSGTMMAGVLISMHGTYGSDQEAFRMTAFACKHGLGVSEYGFRQNKETEVGKYIRSLVLKDRRDFTCRAFLPESFEKFADLNFLENLNETNVLFALRVYSQIDEEKADENSLELRTKVAEKIEEGKKIILNVLNELRDRVLEHGTRSLSAEEKDAIKIVAENGVPHFKIMERSVDYIDMLIKLESSKNPEFDNLRKINISLIQKFNHRDKDREKNINYSHNDQASFYEKSISIQNLDASVLVKALQCFDELTPNRDNFELMQEQVLNTTSILSLLIKSIGSDEQKTKNKLSLTTILEEIESDLKTQQTPVQQKEILQTSYTKIREEIVRIFEEGLGLKNLPEISPEMFEHLVPYLTYLSNINQPDNKKKAILSLFILLKIMGKWESFKRGEEIDVEKYFADGEVRELAMAYLKERKELDVFAKEDKVGPKFTKTLTEKSEAILIGESRGVLDTLNQIENSYQDLEDSDNFSEEEKVLLEVINKFGSRQVGKTLEERYKNPTHENEITKELKLGELENEKATIPRWQKIGRILGSLLKFNKAVREANLGEQINFLEKALLPSEEISEIFRKTGEEMTTESGAMPINEDVEHLESILHKKREDLSLEEFTKAQGYIDNVKQSVLKLSNSRDTLGKEFIALVQSASKTEEISSRFKLRLENFKKLFMTDVSDSQIKLRSTMTGDLEDVIPHIRQCLGCTTQECNNDTNLTFGDRNRYSVITREFHMPEGKSISDELVTLQMTTEITPEGQEKKVYSFLMDNVYGKRDRDVLIVNILTVLSKLKALKKAAPDVPIDIFVTSVAMSSCAASEEYIKDKLQNEFGKVNITKMAKTVHIGQSASGDGHYEIGGGFGGRVSSGSSSVEGLKISL